MTNTTKNEWIDPLDEIRAIRDEHARRFNYDLDAIFADLMKRQKERESLGKRFVTFSSPGDKIPNPPDSAQSNLNESI